MTYRVVNFVNARVFFCALILTCFTSLAIPSTSIADDSQPKATAPKIAKKAATAAIRKSAAPAAGAAVGKYLGKKAAKTIGKAVKGGPLGLGLGILLTPTEIGCDEGETCSR